ncbi:MAG TPA: SGNH/GDSL hydrolase family protein [Stellaceae bacterium]|jgi:lysophospholipase L1-like esterase|nr:SGNH/GDSL hydrolase family protein [Stellaceae bacterium]
MPNEKWVGAWTTGLVTVDQSAFRNQTLRLIVRTTLGGKKLRIRLSNLYGNQKLAIGGAHLALRDGASERIVPGSDRKLTFGGDATAAIGPGALVVSDPVELDAAPLADLAVSLYLPGEVPENLPITGHGNSHQTNYLSTEGDHTAALALPVKAKTEHWYFLSTVEILAPAATGGIVCFGDSLTDGNLSSLDSNSRWPDQFARRLVARGGRGFGVMNQGIGGNRILHDMRGDSGLRRFDRDVLAQPGVTHAIVYIGTNDLRNQRGNPAEVVTTEQMIAGLKQLALRAKAGGLIVYGATMIPYENETYHPGAWTPQGEAKRQAINGWMRSGGREFFDALIDFDKAVLDPAHPISMRAEYDCGDHLHPSDNGYRHMGDAIDLGLFE